MSNKIHSIRDMDGKHKVMPCIVEGALAALTRGFVVASCAMILAATMPQASLPVFAKGNVTTPRTDPKNAYVVSSVSSHPTTDSEERTPSGAGSVVHDSILNQILDGQENPGGINGEIGTSLGSSAATSQSVPEPPRHIKEVQERKEREEREQREKEAKVRREKAARDKAKKDAAYQAALEKEEEPLKGKPASTKALHSLATAGGEKKVRVYNTVRTLSDDWTDKLTRASRAFEPSNDDDSHGGSEVGWIMTDLTTGGTIAYNADYVTYSASCIKGPYIICLLENGNQPTNDMYLAGHLSDNDAYMNLRRTYGGDVMKTWLKKAGIDAEKGQRPYTDLSSRDLAKMWSLAYDYILAKNSETDWLNKTFTDSLNSEISKVLGAQYQTYSKAGWITPTATQSEEAKYNVYTNGGIVMSEHPYVVAITSYNDPMIGMQKTEKLLPLIDAAHREIFEN